MCLLKFSLWYQPDKQPKMWHLEALIVILDEGMKTHFISWSGITRHSNPLVHARFTSFLARLGGRSPWIICLCMCRSCSRLRSNHVGRSMNARGSASRCLWSMSDVVRDKCIHQIPKPTVLVSWCVEWTEVTFAALQSKRRCSGILRNRTHPHFVFTLTAAPCDCACLCISSLGISSPGQAHAKSNRPKSSGERTKDEASISSEFHFGRRDGLSFGYSLPGRPKKRTNRRKKGFIKNEQPQSCVSNIRLLCGGYLHNGFVFVRGFWAPMEIIKHIIFQPANRMKSK